MKQFSGLVSHHCYVITNKTSKIYGITRAKVSNVINQGVKMCCKAFTTNFYSSRNSCCTQQRQCKPNGYLGAHPSIWQPSVTLTSIIPVISSFLFISLSFGNILISNIRFHKSRVRRCRTFEIEVRNSYSMYGMRGRTVKINCVVIRNCL